MSSYVRSLALRSAARGALLGALSLAIAGCERKNSGGFELPANALGDASFSEALDQTLEAKLTPGHNVTFVNDARIFDALAGEIAGAKSSINVLIYIWEKGAVSDRIVAALTERARAGVACRIVVDAFGSSSFMDDVRPALAAAGCDVRSFRPVPGADDLARSHRKIVIVDGRVGFTGGFGIRDSWLRTEEEGIPWRDTNVRVEGPAVADMQRAFAESYQEAGGSILPHGAFPAAPGRMRPPPDRGALPRSRKADS